MTLGGNEAAGLGSKRLQVVDDRQRRGAAVLQHRHQHAAMPFWRTILVCGEKPSRT
jgi:hypothetical protein